MPVPTPKGIHDLDVRILNALLKEGRVTPGYLQAVMKNPSPYVRQRLRALVGMGLVRDLGNALYEPVRERVEALWERATRLEQFAGEMQLPLEEKLARGLRTAPAR